MPETRLPQHPPGSITGVTVAAATMRLWRRTQEGLYLTQQVRLVDLRKPPFANILHAAIMRLQRPNTGRRDADHTPRAARHTVSTQASLVNPTISATVLSIDVTWQFLE